MRRILLASLPIAVLATVASAWLPSLLSERSSRTHAAPSAAWLGAPNDGWPDAAELALRVAANPDCGLAGDYALVATGIGVIETRGIHVDHVIRIAGNGRSGLRLIAPTALAAGWPFYSFTGYSAGTFGQPPAASATPLIPLPSWVPTHQRYGPSVPLRPLMAGLVADLAFWHVVSCFLLTLGSRLSRRACPPTHPKRRADGRWSDRRPPSPTSQQPRAECGSKCTG